MGISEYGVRAPSGDSGRKIGEVSNVIIFPEDFLGSVSLCWRIFFERSTGGGGAGWRLITLTLRDGA